MTQHPGIIQVGRVETNADGAIVIRGWGISRCATECRCHLDPVDHRLVLLEDADEGRLGLRSFVPADCDCCEPWTTSELEAIVRDLRTLDQMETTTS